jgi:hypothetical protein
MMNILPRNLADREAKSPCDKNIQYPKASRPAISGLAGPETIYSCDQFAWIIHSGGFLIVSEPYDWPHMAGPWYTVESNKGHSLPYKPMFAHP